MQLQGEMEVNHFFLSAKQTLSGTITDKEEGMDQLRESLKASLTKLECVQRVRR